MNSFFTRRGVISALTLAAIVFLALANSGNPPNGRTGAPGDGLCSDCHSQASPDPDGSLAISGMPSSIVPNSTYTLTITVSNPDGTGERGGFQMVILNSSNQNSGTLANPGGSSTLTVSGSRTYHEHNPAKFFGAGTQVTYTVDWTSPSGPDMEGITAYAAGIVSNGSGNNSGDLLVTDTESGSMSGSALEIELVFDPVSCFGGSDGGVGVNASGGTPEYTYLWSTGASTQQVTGIPAGTYSVTVTDAQSSTAEGSVEVTEPTELTVSIPTAIPPDCNGDSNGSATASASGGVPAYTYTWSTGAIGAQVTGLAAGTYSVIVSDNNGCTATESVTLSDPAPIGIELITAVDPACAGGSDGSIEVSGTGGTPPFTYIWSSGQTEALIENLTSGVYTVTVSDFNSCSVEETYVLIDLPGIEISDAIIEDVTCAGGSDGSISLEASGTGQLQFSWSNGATGSSISGLSAGAYTVTVTDESSCVLEVTYNIFEPAAITLMIIGDLAVTCFGDMDANVEVIVNNGTPPYQFMWSDGNGTDLGAGDYGLTVTDALGCSANANFTITQPPALAANVTAEDESSVGANDGLVRSEPTGGVPPYNFMWSNGEIADNALTDSIEDLAPGTYLVTVTDQNGCTVVQSGTVNTFGCELDIEVTSADVQCHGDANGLAEVQWSGNNGNVGILWSTGDTVAMIDGLSPGSYGVTVTDTAGCVQQENVVIAEPAELTFELQFDSLVCEGQLVTVMVTPPIFITYDWTTGQTGSTVEVLPGDFCVTVTDANGCTAEQCFTIETSPEIIIDVDTVVATTGGEDNGAIEITVSGGTPALSYMWFDIDGNLVSEVEDPTDLPAGEYYVSVVDAIGCQQTGDTLTVDMSSSIQNPVSELGLTIGPNPASEFLNVGFSTSVTVYQYVIYSTGGDRVRVISSMENSGRLDVGALPSGVYYLAATTDQGRAVIKFVKL